MFVNLEFFIRKLSDLHEFKSRAAVPVLFKQTQKLPESFALPAAIRFHLKLYRRVRFGRYQVQFGGVEHIVCNRAVAQE